MHSKSENSEQVQEHFVTLFDTGFLAQGLALYQSLRRQFPSAKLWVLCMDENVKVFLDQLQWPDLETVALADVESQYPSLLQVKGERSRGEYCWTLSSFSFNAVWDRDASAKRVTYVDADLYFFSSPQPLFDELENSQKSVLITEHAYTPKHDQSAISGRFCVQFLTINSDPAGHKVHQWWQDRCIEWCFDRVEPDRFGDQKYLDKFPELFGDAVHILQNSGLCLAPWNLERFFASQAYRPCFYHFHSFRIPSANEIQLWSYYWLPQTAKPLYQTYAYEVINALHLIQDQDTNSLRFIPVKPIHPLKRWIHRLIGRDAKLRYELWGLNQKS